MTDYEQESSCNAIFPPLTTCNLPTDLIQKRMWTYIELTSLGMNRRTYEDPTQTIDSLEQLHEEGHLKTFFPASPKGARHNTSADTITTVCMLLVRLACVNPEQLELFIHPAAVNAALKLLTSAVSPLRTYLFISAPNNGGCWFNSLEDDYCYSCIKLANVQSGILKYVQSF